MASRAKIVRRTCAVVVAMSLAYAFEARAQAPQDDWPTITPASPVPARTDLPKPAQEEVSVPVEPAEPPHAPFGSARTFLVTSDFAGSLGYSVFENGGESFSASISPGVDYFIVDHVSIGAETGVSHASASGVTATRRNVDVELQSFDVGGRVGVDIPISRRISLYPRASLGYAMTRTRTRAGPPETDLEAPSPYSTKRYGAFVVAYLPVVIRPAPGFIVGVGPTVFHELGRDSSGPETVGMRTGVGARLLVGTYWGGATPVDDGDAAGNAVEPRFGDVGRHVLTGAIASAGWLTSYAPTSTTVQSIDVNPGVDRFLFENVSLGIAASFASSNTDVTTASGRKESFEKLLFAVGPQLGVNVRISQMHSFYPRLWLGAGYETVDGSGGGKRDLESGAGFITARLHAPWLLHLVTHGFVGLGPFVAQDVIRQHSSARRQSRGTSVGASFVVGGWF